MTKKFLGIDRGLIGKALFGALPLVATLAMTSCGNSTNPLPAASSNPTGAAGSSAVASLTLAALPTSVPSDNSASTTVTVTALNSSNAVLPNVAVLLTANTGQLGAASVTTGSSGTATFTFSSGVGNLSNRLATITATSGAATAQAQVQIAGSTLSVFSGNGQTVPDSGVSPATIVFIAKNAQGAGVVGTPISVATTGPGLVTLNPTSGVTDSNGKFTITAAGVSGGSGTATVTASAVGMTASATVNVTPAATTFAISQTQLNGGTAVLSPTAVAMTTADTLTVTVAAPAGTTSVMFATTIGTWTGGSNTITVPVAGGAASANLTTTAAGVANVEVLDPNQPLTLTDTLTVSMTAVTPYAVTLQAAPSVVPKSTGTTTGSATLIATVVDAKSQPVGNAAVAFSIINPTGGGETVSPVIAYTASTAGGNLTLGQASATFTSGSLTSTASGVQIRATVLNSTVQTGTSPSGNDASVVIGGTAGSVAFGSATVLTTTANNTAYVQAMSVLVADASGAPAPKGTVVNLSLWPIAWSTGSGCYPDPDDPNQVSGTFLNEDANENLTLDPGEDGVRKYYASGTTTTAAYTCVPGASGAAPVCTATGGTVTSLPGTLDSQLTPPNSAAGTLASTNPSDAPGTVTTDANGIGTFNLTYGKNSAVWTVVRVRASTVVAGSAAVGEIQFRLSPLQSDVNPCLLPPSPYKF